jgi:hypothetical protein
MKRGQNLQAEIEGMDKESKVRRLADLMQTLRVKNPVSYDRTDVRSIQKLAPRGKLLRTKDGQEFQAPKLGETRPV